MRTARRLLESWYALRTTDRVPTVTLHHSGGRGRPSYRVDVVSYELWRRGKLPLAQPLPQAA